MAMIAQSVPETQPPFIKNVGSIDTGYGQIIGINRIDEFGLVSLRSVDLQWDKDGENVIGAALVECILDPEHVHRLVVALCVAVSGIENGEAK